MLGGVDESQDLEQAADVETAGHALTAKFLKPFVHGQHRGGQGMAVMGLARAQGTKRAGRGPAQIVQFRGHDDVEPLALHVIEQNKHGLHPFQHRTERGHLAGKQSHVIPEQSALHGIHLVTLAVGGRALVPSGIAIALPAGWEAQVRPRSGLAAKHGIILPNAPGTIDSDYRGEIKVIMANLGDAPFTVEPGMRIAQMVVAPVARLTWDEVDSLPETERGAGGFGSTGTKARRAPC